MQRARPTQLRPTTELLQGKLNPGTSQPALRSEKRAGHAKLLCHVLEVRCGNSTLCRPTSEPRQRRSGPGTNQELRRAGRGSGGTQA